MVRRLLPLFLVLWMPGVTQAQSLHPAIEAGVDSGAPSAATSPQLPLYPHSPAPPLSAADPSEWLLPQPRTVHFRVDDDDAQLEQLDELSPTGWRVICRGACDRLVMPGTGYRVKGSGIRASVPLGIPSGAGGLLLDVEAGRVAPWVAGMVLTPVGGVLLVSGFIVISMGTANCHDCASPPPTAQDRRATLDLGVELSLAGIGAVTAGVLLIARNHTSVRLSPSGANEAAIPLGAGVALTPRGFTF